MELPILSGTVEDHIKHLAETAHKVHSQSVPEIVGKLLVIGTICMRQNQLRNFLSPRRDDFLPNTANGQNPTR